MSPQERRPSNQRKSPSQPEPDPATEAPPLPTPPSHARDSVGGMLRRARRIRGLSLEALAREVGCAKSYLSEIENDRRDNPPSDDLLSRLEAVLRLNDGQLRVLAKVQTLPAQLKRELAVFESQRRAARELGDLLRHPPPASDPAPTEPGAPAFGVSLNDLYKSGALHRLINRIAPLPPAAPLAGAAGDGREAAPAEVSGQTMERSPGSAAPLTRMLPAEVPLINSVKAGYPAEFTDLGYPARVADEYVRTPDICDPDAFAARVVGDSMEPAYREGDIVVFSPSRAVKSGMDCFVRLEPDQETTFKRVFFERQDGQEVVRLQPLNNVYPPRTVPREGVAGVYAAVSVTRTL